MAERSSERTERFTLTLTIEGGRMPLTFFASTSEDLRQLLLAIERGQIGDVPRAHWEVETDRIQIAASVNGVSAEDLEHIINDAYQSFKAIEARDETALPRTLNDDARRLSRRIVNRVKRTQPVIVETPGQEPLHIDAEEPETLVPVFGSPPRRERREIFMGWSSVDGELDVISVRNRPYFVIYETGTSNQIRCTFPNDWTPTIKDLLGHRVIAEGLVRYRLDGTASSLSEPTSINAVPKPQRSLSQLRGALPGISGELSSFDYVRQLRTGDTSG